MINILANVKRDPDLMKGIVHLGRETVSQRVPIKTMKENKAGSVGGEMEQNSSLRMLYLTLT